MASAFRAIALRPVRTAVLIGPVHRDPQEGIFLPESDAFSTPLGEIPVDTEAVSVLCARDPVFRRRDLPHLEEHCLEVQLPFLARLFPGLSIVPMLVGSSDRGTVAALSRGLQLTFAQRDLYTVFIVSANMASYMTGKDAEAEAATMEGLLTAGDWKGMLDAAQKRRISTCGAAGIAALLCLAGDGCRVQILARSSSRGVDDDPVRIVSYAAVSIDRGDRPEA
jgi:AmmeMemoRadiSam system protein B